MQKFPKLFKSIGNLFTAKRYMGLLPGGLPINSSSWGSNSFLKAFEISLYTNAAIRKRGAKVGEINFKVTDSKGDDIEDDPILALLNKPNKAFSGQQFWTLAQEYFDLVGECYIWKESGSREIFEEKTVNGLHLLDPTRVTPHFDSLGMPTSYEYKGKEKTTTYKPEEIVYVRNPNPSLPLRGISLIKTGINAIQTEKQIGTYHARVLANGGKVEGVFKFKTGVMTENKLEQVKAMYNREYARAKKAGTPLFLGGDADYVKTGLSPEELGFLEAKKTTLEDICIMTSVPKSLLASTADVKFDNADADLNIFLGQTIKPLQTMWAQALDQAFYPGADKTLTHVDPTPENVDKSLKEIESGIKNYYMTPNEARALRGLDPIDDGDVILIPFNLTQLGATPQSDDEKGLKKKLKNDDEELEHPLKDEGIRRLYWNMQIKRMDARERQFIKLVKSYFNDQRDRVVEQIEPLKTKADISDQLLNIELEIKIGLEEFVPALTEYLTQSGIDAMEFAGSTFDFQLTDGIRSWIDNRANVFLEQINQTTFEKLRSAFADSLEAGEDRNQLVKRIEGVYTNINKNRAPLIARTEVHGYTQFGTFQGYEQSGLTIKIWVAVMDGHTRDSHAMVDGEERPMKRPFSNGLMWPGDITAPAEEVINCRCVI